MKSTHLGRLACFLGLSLVLAQPCRALDKDASTADTAPGATSPKPEAAPVPAPSSLTDREPEKAAAPGDFTMVVLPDTQHYTAASNGPLSLIFTAQTEWIISNRISRNIAYVTLEGDISDHGSLLDDEWSRATNALYRLEDPVKTGLPDGIPYGVAVGNHDLMNGGTRLFNTYFGTNHFAGHRYYGGNYGSNNNSHYDLFSAGGQDFVVVSLVMAAGSDAKLMRWANAVLQSNVNRRAIVVTHSLLNKALQPTTPTWTTEGPAIFNALTNNPNLFLMLCGHRHGQGRRHEIIGPEGRSVDILLADYQANKGGSGYLRLLEFSPSDHVVRVKTFSPWTGQWSTDSDGMFTLDYPDYPAARPAHAAGRRTR